MTERGWRGVRIVTAVATMATVLVPALWTPVRAVTFPTTLARTVRARGDGAASFGFPATHIAFSWIGDEDTGVRYRLFLSGRATGWRRAAEAHDLEHGSHHYSGVISVPRPQTVQWLPVRPRGTEMGRITLDYLNTIDGPRRRVELPAVTEARARAPGIVTRAEWGADESIKRTSGKCRRRFFSMRQLFVHHTVGSNHDPHPKATMRSIYWYHTRRRGFCDIGYNFVIGPHGSIFEGRWARRYDPWEKHDSESRDGKSVVMGAHVFNYNVGSIGVSMMGNYSKVRPPRAMRRSLVRFLAWEADRHNIRPRARHTYVNPVHHVRRRLPNIAGHRDAGQTACPGGALYRLLPKIRRRVKRVMQPDRRATATDLRALSSRVPVGEEAAFAGRLRTRSGTGLPGRKVVVFARPRGRGWRPVRKRSTEVDGRFTFNLLMRRTSGVVAVFRGDRRDWPSQSARVRVRVRG
jgi:hypothetical protein